MRLLIAIMILVTLATPRLALSQSAEKGQALCYQIEKMVNALVDYTQTSCLPTAGKSQGSYSFILLSSQPVFSVEASKKGWVLVSVAAAGDALNKNVSVKAEEIWLSDANQMKNRIAYIMPSELAKSLQRRIKADEINLDTMYSEISKNLIQKSIAER